MSYIRTKDGRILDFDKLNEVSKLSIDMAEEPIRESENIEELCDEFVVWLNENNCHFTTTNYLYIYQNRDKAKSVFGGIWTDKGLIYVAKMNDKGELDLI